MILKISPLYFWWIPTRMRRPPLSEKPILSTDQLSLVRGVKVTITGRSHVKTGDLAWPDRHSRLTLSQTVFFRNNIAR